MARKKHTQNLQVASTSWDSAEKYTSHLLQSGTLQVGDDTTGDAHDVIRVCTEVVVPRSCGSPHLVVLQQVWVNKHAQLCAVTKGRHTVFVFGN